MTTFPQILKLISTLFENHRKLTVFLYPKNSQQQQLSRAPVERWIGRGSWQTVTSSFVIACKITVLSSEDETKFHSKTSIGWRPTTKSPTATIANEPLSVTTEAQNYTLNRPTDRKQRKQNTTRFEWCWQRGGSEWFVAWWDAHQVVSPASADVAKLSSLNTIVQNKHKLKKKIFYFISSVLYDNEQN